MKKILSLLLIFALLFSLAGCFGSGRQDTPIIDLPTVTPEVTPSPTAAPEVTPEIEPGETPEAEPEADLPDQDGYYYDAESVVLYIHTYGTLPGNYITKSEARALGWEGGSVERYQEGAAIGGDSFGNREGLLPRADGRRYTECDLNTLGEKSRGAERLIFSNDGLYFYTCDHYEHFTELTVTTEGKVEWN